MKKMFPVSPNILTRPLHRKHNYFYGQSDYSTDKRNGRNVLDILEIMSAFRNAQLCRRYVGGEQSRSGRARREW